MNEQRAVNLDGAKELTNRQRKQAKRARPRQKRQKTDPRKKKPNETHLQWQSRLARMAETEETNTPLISPEMRSQGDYEQLGNGSAKNNTASPVTRWRANKMLSASQDAAIAFTIRLWERHELKSTTSQIAERVDGGSGENHNEANILEQAEAERDLKRVKGHVPPAYWTIYENCVRFDEPSGVAGSRLGYGSRSAQARAHQVVCLVADIIVMKENITG